MSIVVWRMVLKRYATEAFDGDGARLYGGRWNHKGTRLVYTAGTLSLAALELLIHLEIYQLLKDYVCIPIEFDDALCQALPDFDIPDDWASDPAPSSTRDIGTRWVAERRSVVISVPSVIVPVERNFLINPFHPDFDKIRLGDPQPFHFDPRLIKKE